MTSFQYTLLIVFGVVGYIIIVDKNVGDYLTLVFKMIMINIERVYWMIRLHPKNPITNLLMRRKYNQIAKDLEREFQSKDS